MKRILAILTLLGTATAAHASLVVLTNLSAGGSTTGLPLTTTTWAAVGLQTSTVAVEFNSMKVYFRNQAVGSITAEGGIFSDASGKPGVLLSAFVPQTVPGSSTTTMYTMVTASQFTLEASTDYWFVLHDAPAGLIWNNDGVSNGGKGTFPTAESGYSWLGYRTSSNSGSAWSEPSLVPAVEISVTSTVPEPGTIAFMAVGMIAVLSLRRRRAC